LLIPEIVLRQAKRQSRAVPLPSQLICNSPDLHFPMVIGGIFIITHKGTKLDKIREVQPKARIIINTMHEEMWVVNKMTEKKVNGVIYKSGDLNQLLEAIAAVTSGRQYFCKKFRRAQSSLQPQDQIISNRELEVLVQIAKGYSTKEIATNLFISENTVENHRKNLFHKLQAHNMADLIIKTIAAGYINPEEIINN